MLLCIKPYQLYWTISFFVLLGTCIQRKIMVLAKSVYKWNYYGFLLYSSVKVFDLHVDNRM